MGDVERMLLEAIKPSLSELSKKKIGSYNLMNRDGIYYIFDGTEYLISVKKVQN